MEVTLPDIGEGITEGEVVKWHVKVGDVVRKYQTMVVVMTVKVNVEIPSPVEGRVTKILAEEGKVVKVGEALAVIEAAEKSERVRVPETIQEAKPREVSGAALVLATPAVRKLAAELGADLSKIRGTGTEGRITEEDVRLAATGIASQQEVVTRVPLSGLRRMIAEKLVLSRSRGAHVTAFENVDATRVMKIREETVEALAGKTARPSYLSFIMKALVKALKEYPMLNSTVDDEKGEVVMHHAHNFRIAVDTEYGLMVPVVKEVDRRDMSELAAEVEMLADKARQNKLTLKDVFGGTFSITNYGSIGALSGTPIPNYPEVAILGIGRIEKRPVVVNEKVEVKHMFTLALTFDHRIVDGGYVTRFLLSLKKYLEEPELIFSEKLE